MWEWSCSTRTPQTREAPGLGLGEGGARAACKGHHSSLGTFTELNTLRPYIQCQYTQSHSLGLPETKSVANSPISTRPWSPLQLPGGTPSVTDHTSQPTCSGLLSHLPIHMRPLLLPLPVWMHLLSWHQRNGTKQVHVHPGGWSYSHKQPLSCPGFSCPQGTQFWPIYTELLPPLGF